MGTIQGESYMKSKGLRIKNILLLILVVIILGVSIIAIPYFIPNTPKFSIRKYYQANHTSELKQCSIHDYDGKEVSTEYKEYLLFSKKMSLSQAELEEEVYLVKKLDNEKFNYLDTTDIVKYKVGVYVESTLVPQPQPTVTLIKNKFDEDKYRWVIVP